MRFRELEDEMSPFIRWCFRLGLDSGLVGLVAGLSYS
jgi:hypothetical protein